MVDFPPAPKPTELAEARLLQLILNEQYPPNSTLPAERTLAEQLGVTRPTLREVLQRLARDGWLDIQQGKPTRVCNYWQEGTLAILGTVAQRQAELPNGFIDQVLSVRELLAPAYTQAAVDAEPVKTSKFISGLLDLPDTPKAYAQADWDLHQKLTILSGNPVFTLILNGFKDLYPILAERYFALSIHRAHSLRYYKLLYQAALDKDSNAASTLTQKVMEEARTFWSTLELHNG